MHLYLADFQRDTVFEKAQKVYGDVESPLCRTVHRGGGDTGHLVEVENERQFALREFQRTFEISGLGREGDGTEQGEHQTQVFYFF